MSHEKIPAFNIFSTYNYTRHGGGETRLNRTNFFLFFQSFFGMFSRRQEKVKEIEGEREAW